MVEWIGSLAGFLTTVAFFPQVLKTIKSKSAKDFSNIWVMMMTTGVFLWAVYGFLLHSMPVLVANVATLVCLLALAWVKFR